jgi:hypothetical protein
LHANSIVLNSLLVHVSLQRFPFGRAAFVFSFYYPECRMLKRVFRVRAAPDKRHRDKPAQGKTLKRIVFYMLFQNPLHPVNRAAHSHA